MGSNYNEKKHVTRRVKARILDWAYNSFFIAFSTPIQTAFYKYS